MNKKEIAKEYPDPKEGSFVEDIINVLNKSLQNEYGRRRFQRRFHAKSLGLLEAEFKVAEKLPAYLKVGLFETPKTYRAWVRFSNAATSIGADYNKGVRGMAIKVLEVGEKPLEQDEMGNTQDIILTNNKILFPGTAKMQRIAMRAIFISWVYYAYIILSFNFRGLFSFLFGLIKLPNALECFYFSATPYLFGEGKAVKWQARPLKRASSLMPDNHDKDFLRRQLSADLSTVEFGFELCIQLQEDAKKEPIEDSAVEWKTSFIKVATITILKQDFNTAERKELEERIVFSPWHSMPVHRPLGGINRIRRKIYSRLSGYRMQHNKNFTGGAVPDKAPC